MSRVYIVLANWNGWADTIECLESVFRLDYPDYRVLVCDNASTNDSLAHIRRWAEGTLVADCQNPGLEHLVKPPIPKPLDLLQVGPAVSAHDGASTVPLVLVQTGANLGFAGACNAGIRRALSDPECAYIWLLNNDTVVEPDALTRLVQRMQEDPRAGICGSTLVHYDDVSRVQMLGGSVFNPWVARGGHIGMGLHRSSALPSREEVEARLAYVSGASMLVSSAFVRTIGLMNESYFLYFEEVDWATRAKGRFRLVYSPGSVVYHKEGRSIGSAQSTLAQSSLAEFYGSRNRILFTRAFYPYALPVLAVAMTLSAAHRALHWHWANFSALVRGAFGALRQMWRLRPHSDNDVPRLSGRV